MNLLNLSFMCTKIIPAFPGPLRRMGSQHTMLYDKMVSRRLVGAITMWHDLHSNLLQLSLERQGQAKSGAGGRRASSSSSACSPAADCCAELSSADSELSDADQYQYGGFLT